MVLDRADISNQHQLMDIELATPPRSRASCARCSTATDLEIANFLGGRLYCGRCAEGIRSALMVEYPVCPHGKPIDLTAAGLADYCGLCADETSAFEDRPGRELPEGRFGL